MQTSNTVSPEWLNSICVRKMANENMVTVLVNTLLARSQNFSPSTPASTTSM